MTRQLMFVAIVVNLLLGCYPSGKKEDLTKEDIIERYYEAIGGYERLKSVKTKIVRGKYFEPQYGLSMDMQIVSKRPKTRLVSGTGKLIGYFFEGYSNGTVWEYYKGDSIPRIMEGEAFKAAERGAEFDESFVDFQQKGHDVTYNGMETISGEPMHALQVTISDGWIKKYFLDTESFLIRAIQKKMPLHARGDEINWMVFQSEYKEVDGLMFPHVSVKRNLDDDGKMNNVAVIDQILINPNIDTVNFKPHIPQGLD